MRGRAGGRWGEGKGRGAAGRGRLACSAPPRRMIVHVVSLSHPEKKLYRSPPTWRSSNFAHAPSTPGLRSLHDVCSEAPVAFDIRLRSSSATRPAQKRPRSAKY